MHADDDDPASALLDFNPRVFALCQTFLGEDDEDGEGGEGGEGSEGGAVEAEETSVVAWGMTLPDGSAMAICPDRPGWGSLTIASSPESIAFIHNADLIWTRDA